MVTALVVVLAVLVALSLRKRARKAKKLVLGESDGVPTVLLTPGARRAGFAPSQQSRKARR